MKKLFIFICFLLFVSVCDVYASTANLSISTNRASYVVGDTVNATLTIQTTKDIGVLEYDIGYNKSQLRMTSGQAYNIIVTENDGVRTISQNFSFEVLSNGSSTITVSSARVLATDDTTLSNNIRPRTITLRTRAELEATFSRNNFLSSLSVEGAELSPSFDKEVVEYEVLLEPETREVTISGSREDSRASVEGFGTFDVTDGSNKFEVVVSAQNGNIRTYKLDVIVEELDPIEVDVNGEVFNIVRSSEEVSCLENFESKTIDLDGEEVLGCYNEDNDLILLLLRDSDGRVEFYEYADDFFNLFNKIKIHSIMFYYKDFDSDIDLGDSFSKTTRMINNIEYEVYINKDNRDLGLIYGLNILTGEEGIYQYDFLENTIQRYFVSDEEEKVSSNNMIVVIAVSTGLVISIAINIYHIVKLSKLSNKKNKVNVKKVE